MRARNRKAIFICQISEGTLKIAKCLFINPFKREFADLQVEALPSGIDDKGLAERLGQILNKLGYNRNPVIISLPRNQATCRYLRVPAQTPKEIEKIASLQASRYLPYPADELISGYQIISTDKEGYSQVNLVIVHKDVVERYLSIFKELKTTKLTVALSSYGLCNFYSYLRPEESGSNMIIDIDSSQVELAITFQKKLLFSRAFRFNRFLANWGNLFIDEIKKTQDAYAKEISKEKPGKIVVAGTGKFSQEVSEILSKQTALPVEALSYTGTGKINIAPGLLNSILNSDRSFASILGLGVAADIPESLNLLPQDIKGKSRKVSQGKERLRLTLFISGIILIWVLAIFQNLENKARYLKQLKIGLNKIAKEAKPLEEIEKKLRVLENQALKKPSSLDLLYELHQVMPQAVSLINFSYEEDSQIILRGQGKELNSVNGFVLELQKSGAFKKFNINLRYATQKKTPLGEVVDFEVTCLKK